MQLLIKGDLNFLEEGTSGVAKDFEVEFTDPDADGTYTGTLSLTLVDDTDEEDDGDITVTLNTRNRI